MRTQGRGWRAASLSEVPPADEAADLHWWQEWARDPDYGSGWHSLRQHFGISAFGVNAYETAAGKELVVPHSELDYGRNEELYLVVRGRARFSCDGEQVELGEGDVLYVAPEVEREAVALETPTVIFMVGGTPGEPYRHWTAAPESARS
jgi:mannose-6-phosphate isomerase-like protein (cupin superfamily)